MAQSGIALSTEQIIDILSLYSSTAARVDSVTVEPGWQVFGGFPMPATANIRLDVYGSVSDPALILTVRLYCTTPGFAGEVVGSRAAIVGATVDTEVFSSVFEIVGNRSYQMQAQVVGAVAGFGNVRRAAPAGTP